MVNATQLSSVLYCPRKLFIKEILLVEEPPKEALVKGSVWHKAIELANKSEEKIVISLRSSSYQEIFSVYRKEYARLLRAAIIRYKSDLKKFDIKLIDIFKDYWSTFEEEAKTRALNITDFKNKSKLSGKELWEALEPKIISEQYFKSEKLQLSGIIDYIEVYKDLQVPVELKTGKFPAQGMWDNHRIQLGVYLMLLEDAGRNVREGVLKYKDATDKRVMIIDSMLRDEIKELVVRVKEILGTFNPPEKVENKNKCTHCSFKETCYNDSEMERLIGEAKIRRA